MNGLGRINRLAANSIDSTNLAAFLSNNMYRTSY
jgi:hypothetical protein